MRGGTKILSFYTSGLDTVHFAKIDFLEILLYFYTGIEFGNKYIYLYGHFALLLRKSIFMLILNQCVELNRLCSDPDLDPACHDPNKLNNGKVQIRIRLSIFKLFKNQSIYNCKYVIFETQVLSSTNFKVSIHVINYRNRYGRKFLLNS